MRNGIKTQLLFTILIPLFFLNPIKAEGKKRRAFKRKWSLSLVNGYSFYQKKKPGIKAPTDWEGIDGQMNLFFSSLEISRNFGLYEIGAKIQNSAPTFVSPFFKWNWNRNNSRARFIPSLTLGIVPYYIMGGWLRMSLALSINRYASIAPFIGAFFWNKIKENPKYEKNNIHLNTGIRINLYY